MTECTCPVCAAPIRLEDVDRSQPCPECRAELMLASDGQAERVEDAG